MRNKIKTVTVRGYLFTVDFDYSDEEFYFNKIECDGIDKDVLGILSDDLLDDIKSKLLEDLNAN